MGFFLNPKRKKKKEIIQWLKNCIQIPFKGIGLWCGFLNINYSFIHGPQNRLKIGERCSIVNTLFNTNSGVIVIGNDTIFGHNCMVITGVHRFYKGKRAKLITDAITYRETPEFGNDISIGSGCFIGTSAIILAPVKIGDNVIVGAGAVVTKDVPNDCFIAGVPAKIISYHSK